jgi:protein-L-isoaspartate O-methyltransferase
MKRSTRGPRSIRRTLAKSRRRYPGDAETWSNMEASLGSDELLVGGWQVMQRWETSLMRRMAQEISAPGSDVLEVGFGMGIAAQAIIDQGCRSYTVIEAHPDVAAHAREWARDQPLDTNVIEGM